MQPVFLFRKITETCTFYAGINPKIQIPYIGNFSRREMLAKMPLGRCVKSSLSPIFAISRALNEDVS